MLKQIAGLKEAEGKEQARFETMEKAERWISRMGLSPSALHREPPAHAVDQLFAAST